MNFRRYRNIASVVEEREAEQLSWDDDQVADFAADTLDRHGKDSMTKYAAI